MTKFVRCGIRNNTSHIPANRAEALVDIYVMQGAPHILIVDDHRAMAGALLIDGKVGDGEVSLLVAAEMAAASLVRALEHEKASLLELPVLEKAP